MTITRYARGAGGRRKIKMQRKIDNWILYIVI
jgi:hypothetical protein